MQIQTIAANALRVVKANSQLILTGFAVAGVASTAVLTARATIKAYTEYANEQSMFAEAFTKREVIKLVWRHYIPPIGVGIATIGCIVGSQAIGQRKQAAIVSAYTLAQKGLDEYQKKVVEVIGEKKEQTIREELAQDHLTQNPLTQNVVFLTGNGNTLVYDSLSGRYFESDVELLRQAENSANQEMLGDTMLTLNRLYSILGLEPIELGEEMGWTPDSLISMSFTARLTDKNTPCLVLDHRVPPKLLSSGY